MIHESRSLEQRRQWIRYVRVQQGRLLRQAIVEVYVVRQHVKSTTYERLLKTSGGVGIEYVF